MGVDCYWRLVRRRLLLDRHAALPVTTRRSCRTASGTRLAPRSLRESLRHRDAGVLRRLNEEHDHLAVRIAAGLVLTTNHLIEHGGRTAHQINLFEDRLIARAEQCG